LVIHPEIGPAIDGITTKETWGRMAASFAVPTRWPQVSSSEKGVSMTESNVEVSAAQERREIEVRGYILALIALARQLQDERDREAARDAAKAVHRG
jgi:hypothetical protein